MAGAEMMVLFLPLDSTILKLGWYFELIHFYALHLSIFIMTETLFFPCWIESWDHNPYVKIFSLSACFCGLKTAFFIPIQSFYMIIVEKLKNKGGKKKQNITNHSSAHRYLRDRSPTYIGSVLRKQVMDFPGGPVVKTLGFHCGELGFDIWLGS